MNMPNLQLATALLLAAAVTFPIGSLATQFGDYKPHGFLSDYAKLKPEGGDSEAYVYRNPQGIGKYGKLMIDRIKIYLKEDAESKEIDPAELKELADYFHQAIVKAVEPAYPVVREPGPDVLRLRIAIADLVPNRPEASVVSLVVPFVWVGEAGAGVAKGQTGSTPFVGEVTIEAEALDSKTNAQIGAYIETRIAKKYHVKLDEGVSDAVKTGVGDCLKAYSTWSYTKQAMDHWAAKLRSRLDAAHGK
jgi:hypothetical protein